MISNSYPMLIQISRPTIFGNLPLALMALLPNLAGLILCFGVPLYWDARRRCPGDPQAAVR